MHSSHRRLWLELIHLIMISLSVCAYTFRLTRRRQFLHTSSGGKKRVAKMLALTIHHSLCLKRKKWTAMQTLFQGETTKAMSKEVTIFAGIKENWLSCSH